MKTKLRFLIVWAILACLASGRADATLIEVTDNAFPGAPNNVTLDTVTGLEWLDLTASGGIPYDDIMLQFAAGGDYDGWRHATQAEVNYLFTVSAGLTLANQSGVVDPLATQFIGLVGTTQTDALLNSTTARGRYNDDATGSIANKAGSASVTYRIQSLFFSAYTAVGILDDQPVINSAIPTGGTGHWLVRTVPEPSTLMLLGAGAIGFGCCCRRRRRRPFLREV